MASVPAWVDREAYPFDSRFVDLDAGRVHYVDEGPEDGGNATLLLLHGNPTWSFLYRDLVAGLSDEYRCVALDYLGFGLSERPDDFTYRPEDHADVVEAFVEKWEERLAFTAAANHVGNPRNECVIRGCAASRADKP